MSGIEFLLDTNMVIGLLKGAEPAVHLARNAGVTLARAGVSQITRMELLGFLALSEQEEQTTRAFLSRCTVLGIDDTVETHAIRLRRAGLLKLPDAIVAATALATGARLLTLDQRLSRVVCEQTRVGTGVANQGDVTGQP